VTSLRAAHIHFSLFGPELGSRLVTQMYFPGDPLMAHDPMLRAIPNSRARERLVARSDFDLTRPEWALGYMKPCTNAL
jgi:protocatechuate 3,4-dioxygenase, beta subunit